MIAGVTDASKFLSGDERLVLDLRPHWSRLVLPVLEAVAVVAVAVVLVVFVDDGIARLVIAGIAVLLLLVLTARPFLVWWFTRFLVTDRRVMTREGIVARKSSSVPLSRINDISFEHSVIERILRSGSLVITSGADIGQVKLSSVPRVEAVQKRIYELVDDNDERLEGGSSGGSANQM
jgi:uncharacterized membrane protein YdbT with pleckstrin-like domain